MISMARSRRSTPVTNTPCAVRTDATVQCWGSNASGQIGDGTNIDRGRPTAVTGLAGDVTAVTAGEAHTCALMTTGGVKCWGNNGHGQLGDGTHTGKYTPVEVKGLGSGVAQISAGVYHTCALL